MNPRLPLFFIPLLLFALSAAKGDDAHPFPVARLRHGDIDLTVTLPEAAHGYYRSTRFDWSGMMLSARWRGLELLGAHLDSHDPHSPDSAAGTAEEFVSDETGDTTSLKIGVGLIRQNEHASVLADAGHWTWRQFTTALTFHWQSPASSDGTSCTLEKHITIPVTGDAFIIRRHLTNTGARLLSGHHYGHNFISIGRVPVGTDYLLLLPPRLPLTRIMGADPLLLARGRLRLARELAEDDKLTFSVDCLQPADAFVRVIHRRFGTGITIANDTPAVRFAFYATRRVFCPELFTRYDIAPGDTFTWTTTWTLHPEPDLP
ncbi:hypothetical protein OPIT5_12755 [Opitutaceae bacterium TAV5]|nr:hypothetical protein OPIT5_12755 [Opitutaceae bacterium TAV5]